MVAKFVTNASHGVNFWVRCACQNTSPVSNTKSVSSVLSEYALEKRFMILKIYEPLMEYWAEVWKTLINQLSRQSNALNADWTWKMLDNPRFFGQFTTFAFLERHSQKRRINGKHWAVYREFLLEMGNHYLRGKTANWAKRTKLFLVLGSTAIYGYIS